MLQAAWPADQVERWPLTALQPSDLNARTHDARQIAELAASIREWGWTIPLLVAEGGELIAGHGRLQAALQLGLTHAPVMVARGWTAAQVRAYRIADNRLALSGAWDVDLLRAALRDVQAAGFDVGLTGFDDADLVGLFLPREDGENDPEAEWQGMPAFDHQDKTAFRSVVLHFKDQGAVDGFAQVIGQKITPATRFVWFPAIEIERYADKRYGS